MNQTFKISVFLGTRSYPAFVSSDGTEVLLKFLKKFPSKKCVLIFDRRLKKTQQKLQGALIHEKWDVLSLPVIGGEKIKNIESLLPLFGKMIRKNIRRDSLLIALGGGSVGDAAGFIASTYLRGISWIGIPTSLLAQVDSSIGGKTAVNHPLGKNLIGTFHQPIAVVCSTNDLKTLPKRDIISGMGEAIKYGITYDPKLLLYITKNWDKVERCDSRVLAYIVKKSLFWKSQAVGQDEFDKKGIREVLNFGHTMGHALESATKYKTFRHGEAVIWGMRFVLALSVVKGKLKSTTRNEIDNFLSGLPVPPWPIGVPFSKLTHILTRDKKYRNGRLNFVLLKAIGESYSDSTVTKNELREAFILLHGKKP